jgi:hypothetical protein
MAPSSSVMMSACRAPQRILFVKYWWLACTTCGRIVEPDRHRRDFYLLLCGPFWCETVERALLIDVMNDALMDLESAHAAQTSR